MLCSKSPFELGPIASALWGTCWKCPSQDLCEWGWRTSLFTVCCRVFAWNRSDRSSKQSSRPAACCPAGLCSGEKQKEAKISRGALAGAFAIPLSRRAAEKILVSFVLQAPSLALVLTATVSLSTSAAGFFFLILPWAKCTGAVPLLSFCVPKTGCFFCFLSPISAFAALAWLSPAVTGVLHLLGPSPSVQNRRQGKRRVLHPLSLVSGPVLSVTPWLFAAAWWRVFSASLEMKEDSCTV